MAIAALRSQQLYMGSFVERFEGEFAALYGTRHGVSSHLGIGRAASRGWCD